MTDIDVQRKIVLMKSGMVHWVTLETAEKLESYLANQQAHSFMRIKELDLTLNTSEIEGVYSRDKYEEVQNLKQGKWVCPFKAWHARREGCDCAKEASRKKLEDDRERQFREESTPLTEEQRQKNIRAVAEAREKLKAQGIFR